MKNRLSSTNRTNAKARSFFHRTRAAFSPVFVLALILVSDVSAQKKIAVIIPEKTYQSRIFVEKLESSLSNRFKILDDSLSDAAFRSAKYEKPFNLSLEESKNTGAAIGCDYFLLVKAENQRRNSLLKGEYYESYAVVYAVSSRSGQLVFWKLVSREAQSSDKAEGKLFDAADDLSAEISDRLKTVAEQQSNEASAQKLEELPAVDSPEAKGFRPPLPYRRVKPAYTPLADLYGVEATVDIEIDVDENGKIPRAEITRWAGFGLDESVDKTVRQMNWKPADRDGKNLPMRVLLRYNFRKIEKDEER